MKFLEIGTSDTPKYADLLEEGWDGFLVEAHPVAFHRLVDNYGEKPNATFILAAVSDQTGLAEFSGFRDFGNISVSMSLDSSVQYKDKITTQPEYRGDFSFWVPRITLSDILDRIGSVDKLRLDVEGEEIPILLNYDFKVKPKGLDIEFHNDREGMEKVSDLLATHGYELQTVKLDFGGVEEHRFVRVDSTLVGSV